MRPPILTTASLLESLAYRVGGRVEFTSDAAFLTVGRTTWYAILPPAGRAS
jgi:hypothetical protein